MKVCWKSASGGMGRKKWNKESMSEMLSGLGRGVSEEVRFVEQNKRKQNLRASQGCAKVS